MSTLLISLGGDAYPRALRLKHAAFAKSSRAISGFLKSNNVALVRPEHHLDLFGDGRAWSDQLMAIKDWLKRFEAGDVTPPIENVMVHYVGHGQFRRNSEDHVLTVNSTDADLVAPTSASVRDLNDVLRQSDADRRRIYLIDACFAAASTRDLMAGPDQAFEVHFGSVIGAWKSGIAALCSADKQTTADAGGQRDLTQFTDGLLTVLENGDGASTGPLTLRRVHWLLRPLLEERYGDNAIRPVLVAPDDLDGGIGGMPFFPNLVTPSSRLHEGSRIKERSRIESEDRHPSDGKRGSSQIRPEQINVAAGADGEQAVESSVFEAASDPELEGSLSPDQRFRQTTYRFFRLPRSAKAEVAEKLRVDLPGDPSQTDLDRYKAILERARDTGAVDRLERLIGRAERR